MIEIRESRHFYADLFDHVPNLEGKSLLDIGAGSDQLMIASYAYRIEELWSKNFGKTLSIDKNFVLQKQEGRVNHLPDKSLAGDALKLPIPGSSFDIVSMGSLLHLIKSEDHFSLMCEVNRVLRPGGHFVAGDNTILAYKKMPDEEKLMETFPLFDQFVQVYQSYLSAVGFNLLYESIEFSDSTYDKKIAMLALYNFVAQKPTK